MYSGGSGTALDPYLIATPEDFYNVRENLGAHFKQILDIDFTGYGEYEPPVENFTGMYDGGNFSIKNAEIKGGLFGTVSGSSALIQNVKAENIMLNTIKNRTGVIVGELTNRAKVFFCRVINGEINAEHDEIGGLIGYAEGSSEIQYCWTNIDILSKGNNAGGVVGLLFLGKMSDSYSLGDVKIVGSGAGGVIGKTISNTSNTIDRCYATGVIQGSSAVGGIIGDRGENSKVNNCFALNSAIVRNPGSTQSTFGRIFGRVEDSYAYASGNYAREDMRFYPDGIGE